MKRTLEQLVRPNIQALAAPRVRTYEAQQEADAVWLDANETPYNRPLNRYPDPYQHDLRAALSPVMRVAADQIFVANGLDEAVDLLYQVFASPRRDNVVAIAPTRPVYQRYAHIHEVEYRHVPLTADYQLDADRVLAACDANTKLVWLCSPNDPTGDLLDRNEVARVLMGFDGIVVVDESYVEYCRQPSWRLYLEHFPHLVVLGTMSKAWGCASLRVAMAYAHAPIVSLLDRVKHPYNVSGEAQAKALEMLNKRYDVETWGRQVSSERQEVMRAWSKLDICEKVFPSVTNYFMVRLHDVDDVYSYLLSQQIHVLRCDGMEQCEGCLRVTIGTREENNRLIGALRNYEHLHRKQ